MKRDLYAEVSARIVAELEKGAAPWVKHIVLEPTDYPLAVEQREGITLERVKQIFATRGHS